MKKEISGKIPIKVPVHPEGKSPYWAIRYKNPESSGINFAEQSIVDNIKDINNNINFIYSSTSKFSSLAPTQKETLINYLLDTDSKLKTVGKKMNDEVIENAKKIDTQVYSHETPSNPISRARKHLKDTIVKIKMGNSFAASKYTIEFGKDFNEAIDKYQKFGRKYIQKMIDELKEKTDAELKEKILGNIERFLEEHPENDEKENLRTKIGNNIDTLEKSSKTPTFVNKNSAKNESLEGFLKGYEKLAFLGTEYSDEKVDSLFSIASLINTQKQFNLPLDNSTRVDKVISIDKIAHELHKKKFKDGSSQYPVLDELAELSKSFGEEVRDSRLIILQNPTIAPDIEKLLKIEILQKGNLLEKSHKIWELFKRAIKIGVDKLNNKELVILREWLYAKI